jgi:Gnt-I system high-affinity gluconate transporter/Gnt-II system L-idonate transporter
VAIAKLFGADLGLTLLYSMCLAVPILVIAGIIFPSFVKHIPTNPPEGLLQSRSLARSELPSFGLSIGMALLPVGLMASSTVATLLLPPSHMARIWLNFLGEPSIALLLALGMALIFAGILKGKKMTDLMKTCTQSVESITMILMIIGAGGAFKQVLTDSGIGQQIVVWIQPWSVSPLVLGWLVASCIRIAIGSASVAGLTAAGIVQPLVASSGVSAELMVLSIGAGSLMCSHVNDTGFWMFKEYFGLNLRDTFRTWTAMETIVGVLGLAGVLALNTWVV